MDVHKFGIPSERIYLERLPHGACSESVLYDVLDGYGLIDNIVSTCYKIDLLPEQNAAILTYPSIEIAQSVMVRLKGRITCPEGNFHIAMHFMESPAMADQAMEDLIEETHPDTGHRWRRRSRSRAIGAARRDHEGERRSSRSRAIGAARRDHGANSSSSIARESKPLVIGRAIRKAHNTRVERARNLLRRVGE